MEQAAKPQQIVIVAAPKSVGTAVILALIFGPLGLLYSTFPGALVMFVVNVVVVPLTFGIGLLLTNPIAAVWGWLAAKAHNKKLNGLVTANA